MSGPERRAPALARSLLLSRAVMPASTPFVAALTLSVASLAHPVVASAQGTVGDEARAVHATTPVSAPPTSATRMQLHLRLSGRLTAPRPCQVPAGPACKAMAPVRAPFTLSGRRWSKALPPAPPAHRGLPHFGALFAAGTFGGLLGALAGGYATRASVASDPDSEDREWGTWPLVLFGGLMGQAFGSTLAVQGVGALLHEEGGSKLAMTLGGLGGITLALLLGAALGPFGLLTLMALLPPAGLALGYEATVPTFPTRYEVSPEAWTVEASLQRRRR